jgi:hypothetical protein
MFITMPNFMFRPTSRANAPRLAVTLSASAALYAANACAQVNEPIQTDRPDFVESSNVVGRGRIQLETSLAFERTRGNGVTETVSTTPTLLRIGTGEDWEVRLETDGYTRQRLRIDASGERMRERGYADLSIGAKWHVRDAAGSAPSLGLLVHADLDSGSAPMRGNDIRPSVRMVAEWELPAEFAAPAIARGRYGATYSTYNVGAAYLLSDDCQLDLSMQQGPNRNAPDRAWALGLSTRF